jgi:membrane-associated phospholipid phosphatase
VIPAASPRPSAHYAAAVPSPLQRAKRLVLDVDNAVDRRIDRVRGNVVADRVMYSASELGDWSLIWHLVGVGQALLPGRDPMSAVRLSAILGVESVLVNVGVKRLFRRTRPQWEAAHARPHRLRNPRTSSFPSGHASSAFTAAGVLAPGDPLWPLYYGLAAVVASSRAYVKIHHASDVVAGAALGVALGAVARRVWPLP